MPSILVTAVRRRFVAPLLLFAIALPFYALQAPDAVMGGDAAAYHEQIERLDLRSRAGHVGLYVLGVAATFASPFSTDQTMGYLMALSAAGLLVVTFLMTRHLSGSASAAWVAAGALGLARMFWHYAIFSHYFMPQALFTVVALYAWLRSRPVAAGLSFFVAMAMTPLAVLSLPGLLLRRPTWRHLCLFTAAWSLPFAGLLGLLSRSYLFGHRGVLASSLIDPGHWVPLGLALGRVVYHPCLGFNVLLVFAAIVAASAIRGATVRWRPPLAAAVLSASTLGLFGLSGAIAAIQLPLLPLIAVLIGGGFERLASLARSRALAPALATAGLVCSGLLNAPEVFSERRSAIALRQLSREVEAARPADALLVTDWDRAMAYDRYTVGRTYSGRWKDPRGLALRVSAGGSSADPTLLSAADLERAEGGGGPLWILDEESAAAVAEVARRPLGRRSLPTATIWVYPG